MLIEQRRSTGTASHVFTSRSVVAYTEAEDGARGPLMVVKGYGSHEDWAEITPSLRVYSRYDGTREDYAGTAATFGDALRLACGKPAAGAWYAVRGHARNWAPEGWD